MKSRSPYLLLPLLASLLASPVAHAESAPPIVRQGLDAYASQGAAGAVRSWLRGSPLESSQGIVFAGKADDVATDGSGTVYDVYSSATSVLLVQDDLLVSVV